MIPIPAFWLPIVLATVLCFVAGALLHMLVPLHKGDWRGLPDEDGVLAAMRKAGLTPGNYMFPHPPSMQAMNEPGFVAKLEQGPVGIMTLRRPGKIAMGPYLMKQLLFHLVVSVVVAYLAGQTLPGDVTYVRVWQVVGTAGLLAYTAALFPEVIWYGHPRHYVAAKVVDGVVWTMLTAGAFAGFWPR